MNTMSSNDKNTFYKTTKVDCIDTPYPPDAPAYCTRQSLNDLEATSKEMTRNELDKLRKTSNASLSAKPVTCVPSVEFNPDMHRIMCKYAEKQQQLCNQICEINSRLQRKQDLIVELKEKQQKDLTELRDELSHLTEVNDGNENEITELNEKLAESEMNMNTLQLRYKRYVNRQPIWVFVYLLLYTFGVIFANEEYNLQIIEHEDAF